MPDIDITLKVTQVVFYITAGAVAVLTYLSAKRGLLNTVNTEYQKRVMDRLKELADQLGSEFMPDSPEWWANQDPIRKVVEELNRSFLANRETILKAKKFPPGIPVGEDCLKLGAFLSRIKTDPFIPKSIRDKVADLLQNRADVIQEAYITVLEDYTRGLSEGKYGDTLNNNFGWIHNRILDFCSKRGCGLTDIEKEVDDIRLAIQSHMESFDPLK